MRELAQEHTILFSSHILAEVQDVSSRILVIHRGRLRADGAPRELVASTGRRTLRVEARAEPAALAAALAEVPGLAAAECSDRGEGIASLQAQVDGRADPRDAVAAALARAGLAARELHLELPSLEEYFFAITEGADRAEELSAHAGEEVA